MEAKGTSVPAPPPPSWHRMVGPRRGVSRVLAGTEPGQDGAPGRFLSRQTARSQPEAVWGLRWWLPPSSYLQKNHHSVIRHGE